MNTEVNIDLIEEAILDIQEGRASLLIVNKLREAITSRPLFYKGQQGLVSDNCKPLLNVTVYDGKYTVTQDHTGAVIALRYGEVWRDCCGDGLILALAQDVSNKNEKIKQMEVENQRPTTTDRAG